MLAPTVLRSLALAPGAHPEGHVHLSAASGLAHVGGRFYVVADDDHHLGWFEEDAAAPVQLLRLFDGDLPAAPAGRKARKPDLESLLVLPPMQGHPHGALFALGSGSTARRHAGVCLALDAQGGCIGPPRHVELDGLYAPLHERFAQLNIEGAFVLAGRLRLLQRGHVGDPRNACIDFDLAAVQRWLADPAAGAPPVGAVQFLSLGEVEGVPLCFTDGAALPDGGWVFSAVAENTADTYLDGACLGAAVGRAGPDGAMRWIEPLSSPWKVEGIAADLRGDALVLSLVTDADDPAVAAQLLRLVVR
jgi:hypothetical protein